MAPNRPRAAQGRPARWTRPADWPPGFFVWLAFRMRLLRLYLGGRSFVKMFAAVFVVLSWSAAFYLLGYTVEHDRFNAAFGELAQIEGFDDTLDEQSTALKLVAVRTRANLLRETAQQMRNELYQKERDLAEMKEQLYFYRRVIAPEDLQQGVAILSAHLEKPATDGRFPFELVLRQGARKDKMAKGSIRLRVAGTLDGAGRQLPMDDFYEGERRFAFKYFQRIKGRISLPEHFVPASVEVKVSADKADPVVRMFRWGRLLSAAEPPLNPPAGPSLEPVGSLPESPP